MACSRSSLELPDPECPNTESPTDIKTATISSKLTFRGARSAREEAHEPTQGTLLGTTQGMPLTCR
ncbi:hypothetical protein Pmar_PMAR027561 [Perkinsus marinus ATCC 50983]|uniref:Uncharacterized protein n=1 Tax=Perkinsus marinus (strain ATCC 50983 / TXsc) TaxID=423536 RepID=C5LRD9_PERM5|nr:hypothetical protein Pmar_PMAR027561 [Perkinsus marinus ATCC 50983]EER00703.1 hypothetical protein Pmar_PMAR027561 [Perkinsus marinus ATCC 50983]|eukprot:XP_002767985.1 hypothetical protein Pmar_PMAR027561 [Perkinsus marinus ATCC 50983]